MSLSRLTDNPAITRSGAAAKTLTCAVPMALSFTFTFSLVALGILIGHLPGGDVEENLQTTTLITTLINTVIVISHAMLFGMSILASNERGQLIHLEENEAEENNQALMASKRQDISDIVKNGVILGTACLPLPILSMMFSKTLLINVFQQPPTISALAQTYLRTFTIATPFSMLRMSFEQLLFGFEKQLPAMIISLCNFSIRVGLAYALGFGKFGLPNLGLPGIAYGFTADAILTCVGFGLYLGLHRDYRQFNFFQNFKFNRNDIKQLRALSRIGFPMLFTIGNELLASFLISVFAGQLGSNALAAQDFASQFSFFTFVPLIAFGQVTARK